MELRHLRYFVAVAEELHFRRAAERLHVAQPAISEQVRKLEAELGVLLLRRTPRQVELTPAGAAFLEEARRVLSAADTAARTARRARARDLGRLRVGYMPDSLPSVVGHTLSRFSAGAPGIEVALEPGAPLRLAAAVREGRLDVAVVALPVAAPGLRVTSLQREGAVCAVPSSSPLASAPSLAPAQLGQTPLVVLPRAVNPAFHDGVISAWSRAGLVADPREPSEPVVPHALLDVAAGAGVAILPASAAERHSLPGVRFVPLEDELGTEIATLSRDPQSTLVAGFIRAARSAARAAQLAGDSRARRAELARV